MGIPATSIGASCEFAGDVRAGLGRPGQKQLPCKYLYDDVGSALFEVISRLPEYGLTRADERLLRSHAPEIAARLNGPIAVAELGSGSGSKTRWLLEALCQGGRRLCYYPVELSRAALARCDRELSGLDSLRVVGLRRDYLDGLSEVAARRANGGQLLVLFLGSNIGNFDRMSGLRFLTQVRRILRPGDALLLGADLVKPSAQLLAAYDDDLGVTAAFNRNLLARINRELDADFDLSQFAHLVKFHAEACRVEMHLRSRRRQTVRIGAAKLSVEFAEGETIWTESSHKYSAEEIFRIACDAGFHCAEQWIDEQWPFAENLLIAE